MWNKNAFVPLTAGFGTVQVAAHIRSVNLPVLTGTVCDHGQAFYDWESPIVQFQAAVGTSIGQEDVASFKVIVANHSLCHCRQDPHP